MLSYSPVIFMVKFIITAREFPDYKFDYIRTTLQSMEILTHHLNHGLRTPNEGINQRNLKIWVDVANKICFGRT